MVQQYMEDKWQAAPESVERREEENAIEVWAASEKRELQEYWTHEQVTTASAALVEQKPDLPFSFKLGGVTIKGLLADFGVTLHFAKHNGRYVTVIEGDAFQFEKGVSPVELLQPPDLEEILPIIGTNVKEEPAIPPYEDDNSAAAQDDDVPW